MRHEPINTEHRFEEQYLFLRKKEGRVYPDAIVKSLPEIGEGHPLQKEWLIRKASCQRLVRYLHRKRRPLQILEVGCGNGWLTNQLAQLPDAMVTGIDINKTELQQARRVFQRNNLSFFYGDVRNLFFTTSFDVVVFAASFHYFPSPEEVLSACFNAMKGKGEVHILDSMFYTEETSGAARQRTRRYFDSNGVPNLSGFYFHHSISALQSFDYELIYNPRSFINKLRKTTPFPWIRINNSKGKR
jgi:ubiquinone/menaquinone biosynthesis C-methylase UbiE